MQNLRKTLNQIISTQQSITLTKYDNNTKLKIFLSEPYAKLGLNDSDWTLIQSNVLLNWNEDEQVISTEVNDAFNTKIRPRYYNKVSALQQAISLPTIILSVLCQDMNEYSLYDFIAQYKPSTIEEYFEQLSMLSVEPPQCLAAVSSYIIDYNSDINNANAENGVNMIIWDNNKSKNGYSDNIYGVKHSWDHYSYPHIHQVDSFEHHKILLLNAVKRTWLATLSMTSGVKEVYTRINYGYQAGDLLPYYTIDEYNLLALFNYATVIKPPYDYTRILQLRSEEIEQIILRTLTCQRISPTLNTIYMTSTQLAQERILGNRPLADRITLTQPLIYAENLILYDQYNNIQLPVGDEFSVDSLLSEIEVVNTMGRPEYVINVEQPKHLIQSQSIPSTLTKLILSPSNYATYLDVLRLSARRQYLTSSIVKAVSPDGITIRVTSLAERAVAYVSLNENSNGINLNNLNDVPPAILTLTTRIYIDDYSISTGLLAEIIKFNTFLNLNYSSMNITIVSPSIMPTSLLTICGYSNVPVEVCSLDGSMGTQIDSLFTFNLMTSNMIFLTITEKEYLSDVNAYELFLSDIRINTYYSIEFIDFSAYNLKAALTSILTVLKLAKETNDAKLQFLPLLLNPLKVGARVAFSLAEYPEIITTYSVFSEEQLSTYSREISTSTIVVDPVKSLTYSNRIVPRMGTYLISRCDESNFQRTLGYMSSLCRYVTSKCYSNLYKYYELEGVVDQSRIAIMDRLNMFRENTYIKPEQLIPKEFILKNDQRTARLTYFELVTQTDRMLLYILRRETGKLSNDLSDYGSAHFLNLCMTDNNYVMYDIDNIDTAGVPGVQLIRNVLEWGVVLPYIEDHDVLIYNSLFMDAKISDVDMSTPIITMLQSIKSSKNIYFNLPLMTDQLFELLQPLNIVEKQENRYFLKLGKYPSIPCLTQTELNAVLAIFPSPQYNVTQMKPTLLDYYFTSRMIQRSGNAQVYNNALMLHQCIPLFVVTS